MILKVSPKGSTKGIYKMDLLKGSIKMILNVSLKGSSKGIY